MVNKVTSKKIIFSTLILLAVASLITGIVILNKNDEKRLQGYEDAAKPVGLARAKEECLKEGLGSTCDSMTASATTAECSNGYNCWIIYAHLNGKLYGSVTVERIDVNTAKLHVTDFLKNE